MYNFGGTLIQVVKRYMIGGPAGNINDPHREYTQGFAVNLIDRT